MPFSFNPTVSNGQDSGATQAPSFATATGSPEGGVALDGAPTLPDSPLLFLRARGDMNSLTLNAYAQLLVLLVAVLSVIFSVTLFVYGYYLSSSIESKKEQLVAQEASFKEYPFDDMKKFYSRMTQLEALLKGYVSIRSPLKLLEDVVEKRVYFSQFNLMREKTGGYSASFTVVTTDYQALIQQLEALKLTQYTKVAPTPKIGKFSDVQGENKLQVLVTTPVFVQGVLSDEVVFLPPGVQAQPIVSQEEVPAPQTSPVATTTP